MKPGPQPRHETSEYLDFINAFRAEHDRAPSVREMARHFDMSIKAVQHHRKKLEETGCITIRPYQRFGITVI